MKLHLIESTFTYVINMTLESPWSHKIHVQFNMIKPSNDFQGRTQFHVHGPGLYRKVALNLSNWWHVVCVISCYLPTHSCSGIVTVWIVDKWWCVGVITWQLVLNQALEQAGYTKASELPLEDFGKVKIHSILRLMKITHIFLIKQFIAFCSCLSDSQWLSKLMQTIVVDIVAFILADSNSQKKCVVGGL